MINIAFWDGSELVAAFFLAPACAYLMYKIAQFIDEVAKDWKLDRLQKEKRFNIWQEKE